MSEQSTERKPDCHPRCGDPYLENCHHPDCERGVWEAEHKYTFINGDERVENLNDVELEEIITDIVMNNTHSSFRWNKDQTAISAEG